MTTSAMNIGQKELPEGWKLVKLGDVCQIFSGSTPKSGVHEFWNGEIVWITPTDLGQLQDKYLFDSQRKITQAGFESCSTELIPENSVVMSSRAPIGHLAITHTPLCTNQGCKTFVPAANVDTEFLYHNLQFCMADIRELGSGATFKEVSKSKLAPFTIPLPPLEEQKRIAGILNEQMAAVEEAKKAARERLEAAKALPAAYLREVFPSSEDELPAGWKWVKLGDVAEQLKPGELHSLKSVSTGGSVPVVSQSETGFIGYHDDPPGIHASVNEPIVTFANHTCAVRLHTYPFSTIQNVFPFRAKANSDIDFLYWLLRGRVPATFYGGHMPVLRKTDLPLPPLEEQKRIGSELDDKIAGVKLAEASIQQELYTIEAMPAALLRNAFSGGLV